MRLVPVPSSSWHACSWGCQSPRGETPSLAPGPTAGHFEVPLSWAQLSWMLASVCHFCVPYVGGTTARETFRLLFYIMLRVCVGCVYLLFGRTLPFLPVVSMWLLLTALSSLPKVAQFHNILGYLGVQDSGRPPPSVYLAKHLHQPLFPCHSDTFLHTEQVGPVAPQA